MSDLFFRHDLIVAVDIGKAIELRAGEVLTGVPDDLAAKLLRRPDVTVADAEYDGRKFAFKAARRVPDATALLLSPDLDEQRLAEDEARLERLAALKRDRAKRLAGAGAGAAA